MDDKVLPLIHNLDGASNRTLPGTVIVPGNVLEEVRDSIVRFMNYVKDSTAIPNNVMFIIPTAELVKNDPTEYLLSHLKDISDVPATKDLLYNKQYNKKNRDNDKYSVKNINRYSTKPPKIHRGK
jgi:hypothetical protein